MGRSDGKRSSGHSLLGVSLAFKNQQMQRMITTFGFHSSATDVALGVDLSGRRAIEWDRGPVLIQLWMTYLRLWNYYRDRIFEGAAGVCWDFQWQ
jgi:hypothetical protein